MCFYVHIKSNLTLVYSHITVSQIYPHHNSVGFNEAAPETRFVYEMLK